MMIDLVLLVVAGVAWHYHPWYTVDHETGELNYPTRRWLW